MDLLVHGSLDCTILVLLAAVELLANLFFRRGLRISGDRNIYLPGIARLFPGHGELSCGNKGRYGMDGIEYSICRIIFRVLRFIR